MLQLWFEVSRITGPRATGMVLSIGNRWAPCYSHGSEGRSEITGPCATAMVLRFEHRWTPCYSYGSRVEHHWAPCYSYGTEDSKSCCVTAMVLRVAIHWALCYSYGSEGPNSLVPPPRIVYYSGTEVEVGGCRVELTLFGVTLFGNSAVEGSKCTVANAF